LNLRFHPRASALPLFGRLRAGARLAFREGATNFNPYNLLSRANALSPSGRGRSAGVLQEFSIGDVGTQRACGAACADSWWSAFFCCPASCR